MLSVCPARLSFEQLECKSIHFFEHNTLQHNVLGRLGVFSLLERMLDPKILFGRVGHFVY